MQSHAVTPSADAKVEQVHTLTFKETHFHATKNLLTHLSTITFNGITKPSPLRTAIEERIKRDQLRIDINANILGLTIIANNHDPEKKEGEPRELDLSNTDPRELTQFISIATELAITLSGTLNQFLETPVDIIGLSDLFTLLAYASLRIYENVLHKVYLSIQEQPKEVILKLVTPSLIQGITNEADRILKTILTINTHVTLEDKQAALRAVGLGYNIYTLLMKIKERLVIEKAKIPLTHQFTPQHFLDILEKQGDLSFDPHLDIQLHHSTYQTLSIHATNARQIDEAYQKTIAKINEHLEKGSINTNLFHYYLYVTSSIRVQQTFARCRDSIKAHEFDAARTTMQEIKTLLQIMTRCAKITHESIKNLLNHKVINFFFAPCLDSLEVRTKKASTSNIDIILSDIQLLKDILEEYAPYLPHTPLFQLTLDGYKKRLKSLTNQATKAKETIKTAETDAKEIAKTLDAVTEESEKVSETFLKELRKTTKQKIKRKPAHPEADKEKEKEEKPSADEAPEEAPLEIEKNEAPEEAPSPIKKDVSEKARDFFGIYHCKEYGAFVVQQPPEDRAEALLYAGDYHVLAGMTDTALMIYEEAYDLAKNDNPRNERLMANFKFTLDITREDIQTQLENNKREQAKLKESRAHYIMLLGYEHVAEYPSTLLINSRPPSNAAEYHQCIKKLGETCFDEAGKNNRENNRPLSKYALRREAVNEKIKQLEASDKKAKQLLTRVTGSPLQQHTLFKPGDEGNRPHRPTPRGRRKKHR